jgi:glucoamylase
MLRVQVDTPFRLHWTSDEWRTVNDITYSGTALGIEFVDIPIPPQQRGPIRFTFSWTSKGAWEGRDYMVDVES